MNIKITEATKEEKPIIQNLARFYRIILSTVDQTSCRRTTSSWKVFGNLSTCFQKFSTSFRSHVQRRVSILAHYLVIFGYF
jgi:hypothetical protein